MKLTKALPTSAAPVRDDFDRLFDRFLSTGLFGAAPRVFETTWQPNLDFSENEKEYIVRLEVPGVPKEDLEFDVDGRTVTISGRRDFAREEKTEEYFCHEREAGKFVRAVQLPSAVDQAKVAATYEDGIMTIRLPKAEPSAKTRIQIK